MNLYDPALGIHIFPARPERFALILNGDLANSTAGNISAPDAIVFDNFTGKHAMLTAALQAQTDHAFFDRTAQLLWNDFAELSCGRFLPLPFWLLAFIAISTAS